MFQPSRKATATLAGLATLLASEHFTAAKPEPPHSQPTTQPFRQEYSPSPLANALLAMDLRFGCSPQEIELAKQNIAGAILPVREALAALPKDATTEDKLRTLHTAIHKEFGWGVPSESSYARGIANRQPDCDVFSLIYHEIGREVGLPLQMIITARDDGQNHAFVVYRENNLCLALETRANPDKGLQILHPSEFELMKQFEKACGLQPYSSPLFAVDEKSVLAFTLFERMGPMPPGVKADVAEFLRLLKKGGMNVKDGNVSHRDFCFAAMASGKLSPEEIAVLKAIMAYRDKLSQEMTPYYPHHPFVLGWTEGAAVGTQRYFDIAAEIIERGKKVSALISGLEHGVAQLNAELKRLAMPFTAQRGHFDGSRQDLAPLSVTITATKVNKPFIFANLSNVGMRQTNDGEKYLVITFSETAGSPQKDVILTENGELIEPAK